MVRYLFTSFFGRLFSIGAAFIYGFVSLRLIGVYLNEQEFAIIGVASQLLSYAPMLDGGVRTVVSCRLLASKDEAERRALIEFSQKFYSCLGLVALCLIAVVMGIYCFTPNVRAAGAGFSLFLAFGISSALLVFASAQGNLLIGLQAQNVTHFITGIGTLLLLAVFWFGLRSGWRLWAYPISYFADFLVLWLCFAAAIKARLPHFKLIDFHLDQGFWREFRALRRSALDSFRCQIATMLLFSLEVIIVGTCTSAVIAAVYIVLVRVLSIVRSMIQAMSEVSWPLMAENQGRGAVWSQMLLRTNAIVYAAAAGAMALALPPFLKWYMSAKWAALGNFPWVIWAMLLARFVITGIQSPAGYYLLGMARFATLARWMELEAVAGALLSLLLLRFGSAGVAAGFLLATGAGTLLPIFVSYSRAAGFRVVDVLETVWSRVLLVFGISFAFVCALNTYLHGPRSAFIGAGAALIGAGLPSLVAYFRSRPEFSSSLRLNLKAVLTRM